MHGHGDPRAGKTRGKLGHASEHGSEGKAAALQRIPVNEDHRQENEAGHADVHIGSGVRHDGGKIRIGAEKEIQEKRQADDSDDRGRSRIHDHGQHRDIGTLADPADLALSVILSGEGRHGLPYREHALSQQAVDFICRRETGNGYGAELVDGGLHDDRAGSGDAELQRHRDAGAELVLHERSLQLPLRFPRRQKRDLPENVDAAEYGGNDLRKVGRPGSAGDAHPERHDKKQVEHDVQACGKDQEIKRHFRIPDCPQERREKVVEHRRDDAVADDGNVAVGILVNICRSAHQRQQRTHAKERNGRKDG